MWGPWAAGMAAADARLQARFARGGVAAIKPALGLRLLSTVLAARSGTAVAAPILWRQLLRPGRAPPAIFAAFQEAPLAARVAGNVDPAAAPVQVTHIGPCHFLQCKAALLQALLVLKEWCSIQEDMGRTQRRLHLANPEASVVDVVKEIVFGMLGAAIDVQQVGLATQLLIE